MRKLLLTTAFALPLSMAPAFAQDTAPEATITEDTGVQVDPNAAAADVAASGKVVQQQAANELLLDWITDANVRSPDGDVIGDINDLILDAETGKLIAAVIGVGGFLGIGEKRIAVPWERLTINYDAQEIVSDLTKEEAEAAPQYEFRERQAQPQAEVTAPAVTEPAVTEPAGVSESMEAEPAELDAEPMNAQPMEGEAMEGMEAAPMEGEAMEGEAMEGEAHGMETLADDAAMPMDEAPMDATEAAPADGEAMPAEKPAE